MKRFLLSILIGFLIVSVGRADFPGSPIGNSSSSGTTNASDLSSGTIPAARIGDNSVTVTKVQCTGTKDNTTFLRMDGTCSAVTSESGGTVTSVTADNVSEISTTDNTTAPVITLVGVPWAKLLNVPTTFAHGPGTVTDNTFAIFDGTTGYLLKAGPSYINPTFSTINVYGANALNLGTGSSIAGSARFKNATNNFYFQILGGVAGADIGWILPTAAAGGANYLLNVDVDGTMGYTDPASLGGDNLGSAASSDVIALFNSGTCSGYLKSDGLCDSPAGAGTVTGPASATEDNVVVWGADNTAIKDGGIALSALAPLASPTFTGTVVVPTPFTLGAVSVTPTGTELNFVDGVTSAIQDQLNAKLATDGDGSSLTGITSGQVSGLGTMATQNKTAVDIEGGTIDNTPIGATTPSTGRFTTLEFDEATSTCVPADNNCGQTANNDGDPTGADLSAGLQWLNTGANMFKIRNADNSATLEVFTSGAAHTLNFATSGTLTGGIMILDNVVSPTAAQCYGSWNTITTAGTVTLPAAAAGMSTCIATEGALEITLDLDGSDTFVLAGVTMDAGEAIINTTAEAAGDYICVIATSAVKWRVAGKQGTWTQATP
ncbi:MAG: hypothetical protein WA058_02085 [Minisyncoccia bacterium]